MRSDDELVNALKVIIDYTDIVQEEIYMEAVKRGLYNTQQNQFVFNQIRNRIEGFQSSEPVKIIDISKASKYRGPMLFRDRLLFTLGIFHLFTGFAGIKHEDALINLFFGFLILLISYRIYNKGIKSVALAITVIFTQSILSGLLVLFDLFSDGTLAHAIPLVYFVLGVLSLFSLFATIRYNKVVEDFNPILSLKNMPPQTRYFQNWKHFSVISFAFGSFVCFVTGVVSISISMDVNLWVLIGFSLWDWPSFSHLASAIGFGLILLASPFLWNLARRFSTLNVSELCIRDKRDHILYIRSFGDDSLRFTTRLERFLGFVFPYLRFAMRDITFEESLVMASSTFGPVVAIKEPGRKLPRIGAAREQTIDEMWKEKVSDLIYNSIATIAVLGRTSGLHWELNRLREQASLHKLCLVVPPVNNVQLLERLEVLGTIFPEMVNIPFQIILSSTLIIGIQTNNKPFIISSKNRKENDYQEGIRHAISYILKSRRTEFEK